MKSTYIKSYLIAFFLNGHILISLIESQIILEQINNNNSLIIRINVIIITDAYTRLCNVYHLGTPRG